MATVGAGWARPYWDAHLTDDPSAGDVARGALRLSHGRGLGEQWWGLRQIVGGMRRAMRDW